MYQDFLSVFSTLKLLDYWSAPHLLFIEAERETDEMQRKRDGKSFSYSMHVHICVSVYIQALKNKQPFTDNYQQFSL